VYGWLVVVMDWWGQILQLLLRWALNLLAKNLRGRYGFRGIRHTHLRSSRRKPGPRATPACACRPGSRLSPGWAERGLWD